MIGSAFSPLNCFQDIVLQYPILVSRKFIYEFQGSPREVSRENNVTFLNGRSQKEFRAHTEILKEGLLDMLSKRWQKDGRYVFCPNSKNSKVLDILTVPPSDPKADYLCLPQLSRLTDDERTILKDLEGVLGNIKSSEHHAIGVDLDKYGLEERNDLLFIDATPVDPESLMENPLSVTGQSTPVFRPPQDPDDVGEEPVGRGRRAEAVRRAREVEEMRTYLSARADQMDEEDESESDWDRDRRRTGAEAEAGAGDAAEETGYAVSEYRPRSYFMGKDPSKLVI